MNPTTRRLPSVTIGESRRQFFTRRQIAHVVAFDALPFLLALLLWPMLKPRGCDVFVALAMWLISCLGITAGFHRLFTHRAFCCGSSVKLALGIAGSLAAAGPVIAWAATHRKHHQASDREGDPHSPNLAGMNWTGKLRGFFHAQIGWLTGHDFPSPLVYARDLLSDPAVTWVNRSYLKIVAAGILLPALGVQIIAPGWESLIAALLWGGLVRIAIVHQIISSVNSVCHLLGSRPFPTKDHSRNYALLSILTVGESWHNNHHRHPSSAYLGLRWWEIDLGGWLVAAMRRCGLIWDVVDARSHPCGDGRRSTNP